MMYLISISISNMKSNLTTDLILQFPAPYWISNHAHMITRPGLTWQFFQTADLLTFHILMHFSMRFLPSKWFFFTQNTFWEFHVASIMDYYAIIKKQKKQLLKTSFVTIMLPSLCQFSWSAIISENSEDTVSWLFY